MQDLFLDRVARDQLVGGDDARLADAMGAIGRLRFDRRVPPRIEMDHGVGRGKVEADAACFQTDEEDRDLVIILKTVDLLLPIFRQTGEITMGGAAASSRSRTRSSILTNWLKTRTRCPPSIISPSNSSSKSSLAEVSL